jgi:limonene-1,2-epoxide hydrolase
LLTAGGLGAGYAGLAAVAALATEREPSALEVENARLVTQFCLDWADRDASKLTAYLSDKLVYQMFEGRPDIVGIEAFRREVEPFIKDLARVEWEIRRTFTIGQLVINERIDRFIARPGGRSMHFEIAGLFVVNNGKIELWRDYRLPGSRPRMEVEEAPSAS